MNYYKQFQQTLPIGQLGEKVFATWFKTTYNADIVEYNHNNEWDVKLKRNNIEKTIEVKTDRFEYFKNKITNNIFIEVSCHGKLSGIWTSKADYFVYFFPDFERAYVIETNKLRDIITENAHLLKRSPRSGDGGMVVGYLMDRDEWSNVFKIFRIPKAKCWK